MTLLLSPETYRSLEKKLGEKEAQEFVNAVDATLQEVDRKAEEKLAKITDKADHLINQKKFELKDELTKELATKLDIADLKVDMAELKAEIARVEYKLDRKFTLMFYTLLFAIIFLNQNALEFIAKLLRLM
jgi:hypothetical protein